MSDTLTTEDKLGLFRSRFSGRTDVFGTYAPRTSNAYQVKAPVTRQVLLAHLRGKRPYGVYLLTDETTRAVALDFDDGDQAAPQACIEAAAAIGIPAYVERSKSKGHHVWVFFPESGALAAQARRLASHLLSEIGLPGTEIFPKHDFLGNGVTYGNFINAPLFGQLVPRGRTVFVDPAKSFAPFPDQWEFLQGVQTVSVELLERLVQSLSSDNSEHEPSCQNGRLPNAANGQHAARITRIGLPICAQRMLNQGVTDNQRVACFRLAIHFNRLGVPFDITIAALRQWARKNEPTGSRAVITDAEIEEQTNWAYKKAYRGFGCDEPAVRAFCSPECPLHPRVRLAGEDKNGGET